ncbi:GntR family transcriptional regulator [Methylobacterium sp. 092160098-2]|uniref:GntR family transcriptional regulator n=1 Tax=Methylobacterium sp. 092160098-2 TaxID=3025129 RepID=UPI00406BFFB6
MPTARTRTEALRFRLKQDILARRVLPGQKKLEEDIAAWFGLSRTPVREDLKALTASGLIEIRPHQGPLWRS